MHENGVTPFRKHPIKENRNADGRGIMMTFNAAFPVQNHHFPHQLDLGMKMVCCNLKAFVIIGKKKKKENEIPLSQ